MVKQTSKQLPSKAGSAKNNKKNSPKNNTKNVSKSGAKKSFFLIRWGKAIAAYFVASYGELKKVVWPTRKELMKSTGVVILLIGIFTVVIYTFDTIFSYITNLLYGLV